MKSRLSIFIIPVIVACVGVGFLIAVLYGRNHPIRAVVSVGACTRRENVHKHGEYKPRRYTLHRE
ncbi:MAG: hypothetical protein ACRC2T_16435 [Thermoguttaceae bacterium]